MPATAAPLRLGLACALMLASGFCGLAYQVVWVQQSALWLGQESAAVIAVVAAFFGGLALGAALLGARIEASARPARWYAACEALLGAWSLALVLYLAPVAGFLQQLTGHEPGSLRQWLVAFGGTFLVLLPATLAMGATLPALERAVARGARGALGALYAANTFGALLGVLGTAFWLLPAFGLRLTAMACALLNFACALVAWRMPAGSAAPVPHRPHQEKAVTAGTALRRALLLAATGLLGIGHEVVAVRALSQLTESTVYSFALALAMYLLGTALGAAAHARWLAARGDSPTLRNALLGALAVACSAGLLLAWPGDPLSGALLRPGDGVAAALAGETALAAVLMLLPSALMGALFSLLVGNARASSLAPGLAIGANTLGAALAPPLFSLLLLPWLGLKGALLIIAAGYLSLVTPRAWRHPLAWAPALLLLGCLVWMPPLRIATLPEGAHLARHVEGALASVAVIEDEAGVRTLHINNRQQEGSSATLYADARQGLLPLLLHPHPRHALFLGYGTGLTAGSATLLPGLQVQAVELVPEVIAAAAEFRGGLPERVDPSRLTVQASDARRYLRTSNQRYDVIVADNFHPARSGTAALYTLEHFAAVRGHLAAGGLFCQWLPLHQLDLASLRSVIRSFLAVYPRGAALLATNSLDTPTLGLVARAGDAPLRAGEVRAALAAAPAPVLDAFDLQDEYAVLGSLIAGPAALQGYAGGAEPNTDNHPLVSYLAPRATYAAAREAPRDRLAALLRVLDARAGDAVEGDEAARLAAYWQARNRYIDVGRNVHAEADVRAMLAQVRAPLLGVLKLSPDFRPAYEPLLRMAAALEPIDPAGARVLLAELHTLRPPAQDQRGVR